MGWDPDDLLISPTNTLTKPTGVLVTANDLTNNGGRALFFDTSRPEYRNLGERENDSILPNKDEVSEGEVRQLWVTWDQNNIYFAIVGELRGQGNNIMLVVDRGTGGGVVDLSTLTTWKRKVVTTGDFLIDLFFGIWAQNNTAYFDDTGTGKGGSQWYSYVGGLQPLASTYVDTNFPSPYTNGVAMWYNGGYENDRTKRVVLTSLSWEVFFTNANRTNMWIKVATASTGPNNDDYTVDYMPDTSTPVIPGQISVQDNYFLIRVTDGNGQPIMGVKPQQDAYIRTFPGYSIAPVFNTTIIVSSNLTTGLTRSSTVIVPKKESFVFTQTISTNDVAQYLVSVKAEIFDMKGNLVKTLVNLGYTTQSFTFSWDAKDQRGNYVPMGNYLLVISGKDIGGKNFVNRKILSVIY